MPTLLDISAMLRPAYYTDRLRYKQKQDVVFMRAVCEIITCISSGNKIHVFLYCYTAVRGTRFQLASFTVSLNMIQCKHSLYYC